MFLAVEIFFAPGLTVFGILGVLTLTAGLLLTFLYLPLEYFFLVLAVSVFVAGLFLYWFFKKGIKKGLALKNRETFVDGFKPFQKDYNKFLNKIGKSKTSLRPAGKIFIEGELLSAVSEGNFIEQNEAIQVIKVQGNKLVVRKYKTS
jgi:membrane-bound serine protease (ClpP class)